MTLPSDSPPSPASPRARKLGPKPDRSFRDPKSGRRVEVYVVPANRNAPVTLAALALNVQTTATAAATISNPISLKKDK